MEPQFLAVQLARGADIAQAAACEKSGAPVAQPLRAGAVMIGGMPGGAPALAPAPAPAPASAPTPEVKG